MRTQYHLILHPPISQLAISYNILHIIDSLAFGGAERLLQGVINGMPQHQHLIVHLNPQNDFGENAFQAEVICLEYQGKKSILRMIRQLKRLVKVYDIQLIHSHLMLSNILARLACPSHVQLLNSYHSLIHHPDSPQFQRMWLLLDRWTAKKRFHSLFVSQTVARYATQEKQQQHVLHNYVEDMFFRKKVKKEEIKVPLRLLVLGSFRPERNHQLVIDLFKKWPDLAIAVDFMGTGPLEASFKSQAIDMKQIRFCGFQRELASQLANYDLLLAPSLFEGFGLAVAEAMAAELPVLAADISAFQEVTGGHALFFDPAQPASLHTQIQYIMEGEIELHDIAMKAKRQAKAFQKTIYLQKLNAIYDQLMKKR